MILLWAKGQICPWHLLKCAKMPMKYVLEQKYPRYFKCGQTCPSPSTQGNGRFFLPPCATWHDMWQKKKHILATYYLKNLIKTIKKAQIESSCIPSSHSLPISNHNFFSSSNPPLLSFQLNLASPFCSEKSNPCHLHLWLWRKARASLSLQSNPKSSFNSKKSNLSSPSCHEKSNPPLRYLQSCRWRSQSSKPLISGQNPGRRFYGCIK